MAHAEPLPAEMLDRLVEATNAHDLDALVDCFAPDYVNETPVHPARGFVGADQVRRNWEQIFGLVPDLTATVSGYVVAADEVWSEWQMSGTRPDGSAAPHARRHHLHGARRPSLTRPLLPGARRPR